MIKGLLELNAENYHSPEANKQYMSVSQYKSFKECEAKAKATIDGRYKRPETKAFLIGKYNHKWCEGNLQQQFLEENRQDFIDLKLIKKNGAPNAELERMDNVVLPACEADEVIMLLLEGEKEVIFTTMLFGIPFKVMLDVYNRPEGYISDPKFVADMDRKWNKKEFKYESFIEHYSYDMQMVVYAEVERIETGNKKPLSSNLIVITKEPVPHKKVFIDFDAPSVRKELLGRLEADLPHIMAVKNGEVEPINCGECAYCKSTMETQIVPYWSIIDGM